ncbi:hypothetical protein VTH06DRAFT_2998 [Thermothelomyces fergusii]
MAGLDEKQSGPNTSQRKKHTGKSKTQPAGDWPRTGEPRTRASPRRKRPADIDKDLVSSSSSLSSPPSSSDEADEAKASSTLPRKQRRRLRPQAPALTSSDTSSSDTSAPAKTPPRSMRRRLKSRRVPNEAVSPADRAPPHRRPTYVFEDDDADDTDDAAPPRSRPSRPSSRQTIARRESSPRSAHRYRSTPESRRSVRTSVSDSEDDTGATTGSDSEQVILPPGKPPPPAPMAPPIPPVPSTAAAVRSSLQERLSRRPEMVYEEDDGDGTSRYAPSVTRHRSLSRPASSRRDSYRRPRDVTVSSPASLDETHRSRSRSKSARPSRRHYESDVYTSSRPASSFKRHRASSPYSQASSARRSSLVGDFAESAPRTPQHEKAMERMTVCVSCRDDTVPVSKTVKLKCLHRMCHSCLRKAFKRSLTDPQQYMPPRCCTSDNIPPRYVDMLFDSGFKKDWNEKYMEHASRRGFPCPSRRCGEIVKPENMRSEGGRWVGRCARCKTKVCGSCNGRWHPEPDCTAGGNDSALFAEELTREPWRRCYRCKAVVEVKGSSTRNHASCRCGAEFCLGCGGKWKTCDCPVFKDDLFDTDAADSRPNPFASRPASPRELRSDFPPPLPATARTRRSSYEEDAHIRRFHEFHEDHSARRMHSFDETGRHGDSDRRRDEYSFDDLAVRRDRDRRRRAEAREYAALVADEDYHRRAATVVAPLASQPHVPSAPPPPRSAFEPPSRPAFDRSAPDFDYGTSTHRGRATRYESPDGFDDYLTDSYQPERRRPRTPDFWAGQALSKERRSRSRDRRHTYPSESRPSSPDVWQLPTRYPSPERPIAAAEERRRPPSSPERRRASSLERRLAGRFKEPKQSAAATVGPGALSPVGALDPLSPPRALAPPSRPATHIGTTMPVAPPPPPPPAVPGAPPPMASIRRHHTVDDDLYGPGAGMAPVQDWFGPSLHHGHPHAHLHSHPPAPGMGPAPFVSFTVHISTPPHFGLNSGRVVVWTDQRRNCRGCASSSLFFGVYDWIALEVAHDSNQI